MAREGSGAVLDARQDGGSRAGARSAGGRPTTRFGRVLHLMGRGMPKVKNWPAPLVLLVLPYVFAYVLVLLLVLTVGLVIMMIWLVAKVVLALPQLLLRSVTSGSTVVEGAHRELADDDQLFGAVQDTDDRQRETQALGLADPGEADRLTATAASLWASWQRSFVSGEVDQVRPTMTEGYWRLHRLLVQSRTTQGVARVFDGRVTGAELESAHHRSGADEVRLKVTCSGTSYDQAGGLVLRGSTSPTTWVEHLTLRRGGGTTGSGGVLPSSCPNCGSPLHVGEDGQCTACGALAAPRNSDWALANTWRASW